MADRLTVLFFAANPKDLPQLALDEQVRQITLELGSASEAARLDFHNIPAARSNDLLLAFSQYHPQVFHFSGHGGESGEIYLQNDKGFAEPVPPEGLKQLFATFQSSLKLVYLDACFSAAQAETLAEIAGCVIGSTGELADTDARRFTVVFYRALARPCSLREAYDQGCSALALQGISRETYPRLVVRPGMDPSALRLLETSPPTAFQPRLDLLHQLPPPPADFTGREKELKWLETQITRGGVMISGLRGIGGIGKTSLALVLASRLREQYPDAQLYINLRGASPHPLSPEEALATAIHPFQPDLKLPEDMPSLRVLYYACLQGRRMIVLLDDVGGVSQIVNMLPPLESETLLIITSRQRFSLPGLESTDLDSLVQKEARHLLKRCSPRLKRASAAELDELANLCGRLPLALRIAASIYENRKDWDFSHMLASLGEERTRLDKLMHENLDVNAALDLSYDRLNEQHQQHYRALGVFPAPFDLNALAVIWGVTQEAADIEIGSFIAASLVDGSGGTYRLHDLIRLHSQGLLLQNEIEAKSITKRHAGYYLEQGALADELYQEGHAQMMKGLNLFRHLWHHLDSAWQRVAGKAPAWPCIDGAEHWLSEFPGKIAYVHDLHLAPGQKLPYYERALEAARGLNDQHSESVHLLNIGKVWADLGETQKAIEYYEQSLEVDRHTVGQKSLGRILGNLGIAWAMLDDPNKSIDYLLRAIKLDRESGNRRDEGADLVNLGLVLYRRGSYPQAIGYFNKALEIDRQIGDRRGEGADLGNLGNVYLKMGKIERAIVLFEQRLVIAREIRDLHGTAIASWNLGQALEQQENHARAAELMQVLVDYERQIGHPDAEKDAAYVEELLKKI